MQTRDNIISFLKENKQIIQEKYDVEKIALFGSFARDEASKDSDIDIIVDMKMKFGMLYKINYHLFYMN